MTTQTLLHMGNHLSPDRIIQGPLAGISAAPFRLLCWQYGAPAFCYTEMVSCKTLIHHPSHSISPFLQKLPGEGPLGAQLSGTSPTELAEATRIATASGVDLIDLNCGCPVPKIRRRGAGSSLLGQPKKLYHLIHAMKQNTHLPVSIKIRVDGDSADGLNREIVQVIRDAGPDFLIVHGRHWQEGYETPCHYAQIRLFVESLDIPVIGNGDIACSHSLGRMLATGCAGVMISRAGVGQPWLTKTLMAEIKGELVIVPHLSEMGEIFFRHVELLADFLGKERDALQQSRKFCKYYARTMTERAAFCAEVNQCETLSGLREIVSRHFDTDKTG